MPQLKITLQLFILLLKENVFARAQILFQYWQLPDKSSRDISKNKILALFQMFILFISEFLA